MQTVYKGGDNLVEVLKRGPKFFALKVHDQHESTCTDLEVTRDQLEDIGLAIAAALKEG